MSPAAQLGSETVVTNGAAAIAQPLVREFRHVSIKEKGEKKNPFLPAHRPTTKMTRYHSSVRELANYLREREKKVCRS